MFFLVVLNILIVIICFLSRYDWKYVYVWFWFLYILDVNIVFFNMWVD